MAKGGPERANRMKVIIFTEEKVGEGHFQAAKAVQEAIHQLRGEEVQVILTSGMRLIHPLFERGAAWLYLAVIRYIPQIWSAIYHRIHTPFKLQQALFRHRLCRYLEHERPHVVLCAHPACIKTLAQLKKEGRLAFKLGVIFTDFGFHPFAVAEEADYFFVPHHTVKQQLVQHYKIDPAKVWPFGIPVHPRFEKGLRQREGHLDKEDKGPFHLLIMGGALGLGPIQKIMEQFALDKGKFKVTIICGRNRALYRKLLRKAPEHITVLGYVSNVDELMVQADAVLSKPGGLTATETLLCRTPLFMLQPLPGQEENNRRWLEERRLAVSVGKISGLSKEIIRHLEKLDQEAWSKRVDQHIRGDAALMIARKILAEHGTIGT